MIDTINLKYKLSEKEYEQLRRIFDEQYTKRKEDNSVSIKYFMNKEKQFNYTLMSDYDHDDLIKVTGSIPKQLKGNNYLNHVYDDNDVKRFYEKVNDELKIKLTENKLKYISRFDCGINLNHSASVIIDQFKNIDASRLKKVIYNSSLYFKNKTRQFRIYDKVKEIEEKDKVKLVGKIITRFETQLQRDRNIKKLDIHTVSDLLNKHKQKAIFNNTYEKVINNRKLYINEIEEEEYEMKLSLNEYSKLRELESVLRNFGDLEIYRQHLKSKNYNKSTISRHISKLRRLLIYVRKEKLIDIDKEIREYLSNI